MADHRQHTTTNVHNKTKHNSVSNTAAMKAMYPNSPLWDETYQDKNLTAVGQRLLLDEVVDDSGHTFGSFDRNFTGAPDLNSVETGAGGKPASPFVPNLTSPGEGSLNAEDKPEMPKDLLPQPSELWGAGVNPSQRNPKDESKKNSSSVIGNLQLGKSSNG